MKERLANEILDAVNNHGRSMSRRRKTPTRWQKPTRLSLITDGNLPQGMNSPQILYFRSARIKLKGEKYAKTVSA